MFVVSKLVVLCIDIDCLSLQNFVLLQEQLSLSIADIDTKKYRDI